MYDESLGADIPLKRSDEQRSFYTEDEVVNVTNKFLTKEELVQSRHAEQQQLCDDGLLCCYDYLLVMSCE